MQEKLSDEKLVLKARNDKTAVSELIARYMCTAEVLAKKLSPDLCDDLMQEGLMGLMKAIKSFNGEREVSFSSYASVCMKNKMLNSLRKNNSSRAAEISEEEIEEYAVGSQDDIPEDIVIEKERMSELYEKISSALSEREWQVFQLFLTGMSYNQIALNSGLSAKGVNNAMQRVRRKLKSVLR